MHYWKSWKYKNLTILFLSILFAYSISQHEPFRMLLLGLGSFGYASAFIAGALFVSTFTVATGAVILFILAETLSPLEIGVIAGAGAVLGDFTIFRFIKDNILSEIQPIYNHFGGNHLTHILHTKYFSWTLPVIGAIIIASPFPDEIGVSLMGISRMKSYEFIIVSFLLNAIGIFLIISASSVINP